MIKITKTDEFSVEFWLPIIARGPILELFNFWRVEGFAKFNLVFSKRNNSALVWIDGVQIKDSEDLFNTVGKHIKSVKENNEEA